jgi:hypothetical protein
LLLTVEVAIPHAVTLVETGLHSPVVHLAAANQVIRKLLGLPDGLLLLAIRATIAQVQRQLKVVGRRLQVVTRRDGAVIFQGALGQPLMVPGQGM